jgi:glutathione S-transferase
MSTELRLYVVHGSHPCTAVERALQMKGLPYRVWEWPPPLHSLGQRLIFGSRTVPALTYGAEKLIGSTTIMRRLDELVPEPRLFPADPGLRARVEAANEWGFGDFQQVPRDLIWVGLQNRPEALVSYGEHSKLSLPAPVIRASAPAISRAVAAVNRTNPAKARRRLTELPALLDTVDGWIADGTIGNTAHPSAADLQLLSTVRLLSTIADVRPVLDGRPCYAAATTLFPKWDGELPAGALTPTAC